MTTMTPQDLLLKAADHIETYGFAKDIGWVVDYQSPTSCPACTGGALALEVSAGREFSPNRILRASERWAMEEAVVMLCEYLGVPTDDDFDPIVEWNDAPERTQEDVVEALRAAAASAAG